MMYYNNPQLEKCLIYLINKSGDVNLSLNFQRALSSQRIYEQRERAKFKKEIIDEILQQISLTTNAEEIISQIKDLQKGLDDLYKTVM